MIAIAAILSTAAQRWEDFAIIAFLLLIDPSSGFWEQFKTDNAKETIIQRLAPAGSGALGSDAAHHRLQDWLIWAEAWQTAS